MRKCSDLHASNGLRLLALILPTLALAAVPASGQARRGGLPSGRWLGQDGSDFVGPSSKPGPSGVQDIHVRLSGLSRRSKVETIVIKGDGGDEWQYNGPYGPYLAHLEREEGSPTADLYFEPTRVETGRSFSITITVEGGQSAEIYVQGGRANPGLRTEGARVKARWVGQDGQDRAGPGPAVGPDGLQDAVIALENLATGVGVEAVTVKAPGGASWESGLNPDARPSAELVREGEDSPTAAFRFQPDRDRNGQALKLAVRYENGTTDEAEVVAGKADPGLAVESVKIADLAPGGMSARWVGQDDDEAAAPGSIRVAVEGLPRSAVVAAALTDEVGGAWIIKAKEDVPFEVATYPLPLMFDRRAGSTRAEVAFPPIRDESGGTMTLRVRFADGRERACTFPGGTADPTLRGGPGPSASETTAKPGADLNELAKRYGTIRLEPGEYRLDRPLVLPNAVQLIGEGADKTQLVFDQPPGAEPWTAAIKVHAGRTTLERFAVRFAGPVRWDEGVAYGPAVIGTTDDRDQGGFPVKAGLSFRNLDLESPPPSEDWQESARLIRLATAESGVVENCTLRGGMVEFLGGPWRIAHNIYRGTPPRSTAQAVFAGHRTHDLALRGNRAEPDPGSGKTWRFLVLTVGGWYDFIDSNTIIGIGPRDDDPIPHPNAPEIILTEAYRLRFEGRPLALSPDRRTLVIPEPQGEPAEPGDVVAILEGPGAGTYRQIAQRINRTTYLLDEPLWGGTTALSIATGFVGENFRRNTIDATGSSQADGFVLVGNHFGTRMAANRVRGGRHPLRLTAAPTEYPVFWGWSHAPAFGVVVAGNRFEGSSEGVEVAVEAGPPVKTTAGRVYLDATLEGNVSAPGAGRGGPPSYTIGDPRALDPGRLVLKAEGNVADAAGVGPVLIHAATLDGVPLRDQRLKLPVKSNPVVKP